MDGDGLTAKQRLFVEHYFATFNASEAARRAGYSAATAAPQASHLLTNVNIKAAIKARMLEIMPAAEVVNRLADHARSSMAEFVVIADEKVVIERRTTHQDASITEETEYTMRPVARLDMARATQAGKLHLVKKYSLTDKGVSIELYDAQAALEKLGKMHGLFIEKQELSGGMTIRVIDGTDD